ncbi:MAG: hypothetical protein VX672_05675 [Planctomycetota bacterium]|nr:hypothetical protein [Planctomycetota bacterium]
MNLLWPHFHDSAYRPTLAERLSIHWKANLKMLRHPWDLVLFTVITFAPVGLLYLFMAAFPGIFLAPGGDLATILFATVTTFLFFLVIQHIAFVVAMNLTYVPHVHAVLKDRGIPVCARCGHRLPPTAPGSACPECGQGGSSATMFDSGPGPSGDDGRVVRDRKDPRR